MAASARGQTTVQQQILELASALGVKSVISLRLLASFFSLFDLADLASLSASRFALLSTRPRQLTEAIAPLLNPSIVSA